VIERIPLKRLGTPPDMACAALFLASPLASYVVGQTIVVDGGLIDERRNRGRLQRLAHRQSSEGVSAMDKDRIAGSAKDFAGKVEGAVGSMAGDAKTQASGLVREVEGLVQNLYGQAEDAYENSAVAKKVEDNPLGALLVAGGIGFALAMLMTRPLLRSR
jgi:uncharacterized protein YjbJ (UPF0337 family)